MKLMSGLAMVMLASASPLCAETPAASTPSTAKLSIDSPIEQIAANADGRPVLDANFPGMTAHPAYEQFKGMTLKQLQPMSNGQITDDAIAKAAAALTAVQTHVITL
jgi:hypothetical protein